MLNLCYLQVEWVEVPRRREGGGGGRIVTAHLPFRDSGGRPARATVLYSHGNAVDLGQVMPLYRSGFVRRRQTRSHAEGSTIRVLCAVDRVSQRRAGFGNRDM